MVAGIPAQESFQPSRSALRYQMDYDYQPKMDGQREEVTSNPVVAVRWLECQRIPCVPVQRGYGFDPPRRHRLTIQSTWQESNLRTLAYEASALAV